MAAPNDNSPRGVALAATAAAAAVVVGTAEYFLMRAAGTAAFMPAASWAHRVFAYGWVIGAATIAGTLSLLPGRALLRRAGLDGPRAALAGAAAFLVAVNIHQLAAGDVFQRHPGRIFYYLSFFPPVFLALWAGVYTLLIGGRIRALAGTRVFAVVALGSWTAFAVAAFAPSPFRPVPRRGAPNIVLITIDTLRADEVGPRRAERAVMPNLEAYRGRGVTFVNARSPAPWTRPGVAAILTGLPPSLHLYREADRFDPKLMTMAEALAAAGYDAGAAVSNRVCEPELGFARGFGWYRSGAMRGGAAETRLYWTSLRTWAATVRDLATFLVKGKEYFFDYGTTPRVTRDALSYIKNHRRRRPYFLWVHYFDPHAPYTPPPAYVAPEARPFAARPWDYAQNIPLARELYDGEASYVDAHVKLLLAALAARGPADRTVVIVTSDHGEEFGEHGGTSHGYTLYAELLDVPFILVAPGVAPAGAVRETPVSTLDIMPTALELAGAPVPPWLPGRSLLAPARGEASAPRAFVGEALVTQEDTRSIEADGWKLIWFRGANRYELYEPATDPGEHKPREAPFVVAGYERRLAAWERDNAALRVKLGLAPPARDERAAAAVHALGYIR